MADDELRIAFTDVLYGVVIGNAIWKLEFGLTVTNGLMFFALAVIADDWVGYKISLAEAEPTRRNRVYAFLLDFAILVTWYFLTIVPEGAINWFLALLAVFFALGAWWSYAVLDETTGEAVMSTHGALTGITAALAGFATVTDLDLVLVAIGFLAFLGVRGWYWVWGHDEELDGI